MDPLPFPIALSFCFTLSIALSDRVPTLLRVMQPTQRCWCLFNPLSDSKIEPLPNSIFASFSVGELKSPPRPKEVKHPEYTIVPPKPGEDPDAFANQEFLAQTDITWKGYAASVGRDVDGSELYETQ